VVCCDIFGYYSPTPTFSSIELSIQRGSKKVVALYFYYSAPASWKDIEQTLGGNYSRTKLPGGQFDYLYNYQGHQLSIIVDSAKTVHSVVIW